MPSFRPPAVLRATALLAIAAACVPAQAQFKPGAVFVQAGGGDDGLTAVSIGALWPWAWRAQALGGQWSVNTELFVSTWRADAISGGERSYVQLGVMPLLRYTFDQGRSPWFAEAGIGLSVLDREFVTPTKRFGTTWNFSDNLAIGRSFGAKGEHEVSLRWQHTSNAGLKQPNPGLNTGLVRYTMRF
jgi:lipid A 3-O-deacylase